MPTIEEALIEDTFGLIAELDQTDDADECNRLRKLIQERSDRIGELSGYVLRTVEGEELVACLDYDQAKAIQFALLMAEGGTVTTITEGMAPLIDFVHPTTLPASVALTVLDP